ILAGTDGGLQRGDDPPAERGGRPRAEGRRSGAQAPLELVGVVCGEERTHGIPPKPSLASAGRAVPPPRSVGSRSNAPSASASERRARAREGRTRARDAARPSA